MYFFLLTYYSNNVVFYEIIALTDWFKKKTIAKITKGATFWKYPLDNTLFRMLYF